MLVHFSEFYTHNVDVQNIRVIPFDETIKTEFYEFEIGCKKYMILYSKPLNIIEREKIKGVLYSFIKVGEKWDGVSITI